MQFHLVEGRLDAAVAQDQLKLGPGHVADAQVPDKPCVDELFKFVPEGHELFVDIGAGRSSPARDVAVRFVRIREWPVHEVEVQVVESQVGKRLFERFRADAGGMPVVPQLARNPQLVPPECGQAVYLPRHGPAQDVTDFLFVAVDCGAVDVAVACLEGRCHCLGNDGGIRMVAAECPETDGRYAEFHCFRKLHIISL